MRNNNIIRYRDAVIRIGILECNGHIGLWGVPFEVWVKCYHNKMDYNIETKQYGRVTCLLKKKKKLTVLNRLSLTLKGMLNI